MKKPLQKPTQALQTPPTRKDLDQAVDLLLRTADLLRELPSPSGARIEQVSSPKFPHHELTALEWADMGMVLPNRAQGIRLNGNLIVWMDVVTDTDEPDTTRFIHDLDFASQQELGVTGPGGAVLDTPVWLKLRSAEFPVVCLQIADPEGRRRIVVLGIVIPSFNSNMGVVRLAFDPEFACPRIAATILGQIEIMARTCFHAITAQVEQAQLHTMAAYRAQDFDETSRPDGKTDFRKELSTPEEYCSSQ